MKKILILLMTSFLFVACKPADKTVSLAGEWRFALDPEDKGIKEQWAARP